MSAVLFIILALGYLSVSGSTEQLSSTDFLLDYLLSLWIPPNYVPSLEAQSVPDPNIREQMISIEKSKLALDNYINHLLQYARQNNKKLQNGLNGNSLNGLLNDLNAEEGNDFTSNSGLPPNCEQSYGCDYPNPNHFYVSHIPFSQFYPNYLRPNPFVPNRFRPEPPPVANQNEFVQLPPLSVFNLEQGRGPINIPENLPLFNPFNNGQPPLNYPIYLKPNMPTSNCNTESDPIIYNTICPPPFALPFPFQHMKRDVSEETRSSPIRRHILSKTIQDTVAPDVYDEDFETYLKRILYLYNDKESTNALIHSRLHNNFLKQHPEIRENKINAAMMPKSTDLLNSKIEMMKGSVYPLLPKLRDRGLEQLYLPENSNNLPGFPFQKRYLAPNVYEILLPQYSSNLYNSYNSNPYVENPQPLGNAQINVGEPIINEPTLQQLLGLRNLPTDSEYSSTQSTMLNKDSEKQNWDTKVDNDYVINRFLKQALGNNQPTTTKVLGNV